MKLLKKNKGFTVVELVIVIGVIAILSAILIPTFVNVTENAKKSAAQADCRTAYSAYVLEAHDGVYDEGTAYAGQALHYAEEKDVQLTRNEKDYVYDQQKGWIEKPAADARTFVIVGLTDEASTFEGILVKYAA